MIRRVSGMLLFILVETIRRFSPEERQEFLYDLSAYFCFDCGKWFANGEGVCHCRNDE